ncbi:MAG TPA: hypothetical protein DDW50_01770 [Firmicutes bacterium]|jgi:hypothetical protein|nr:hypothetical protein [Bacillota bacterium]
MMNTSNLTKVIIKLQDMPAALTENFQDVVVYRAELPSIKGSISMNDAMNSIFAVIVSKDSTYDEIISQLQKQAESFLDQKGGIA